MADPSDIPPTLEEFQGLRRAAEMSVFPDAAVALSLDRTLHGVWLREDGQLIAMGRLTGDEACFVQVNDVVVHPKHQRRGLGTTIMQHLMAWADTNLPRGCYISLIADAGAETLYAHAGFERRTGMARRAG
jgi:GNAT superfamily N-acetyltransferase